MLDARVPSTLGPGKIMIMTTMMIKIKIIQVQFNLYLKPDLFLYSKISEVPANKEVSDKVGRAVYDEFLSFLHVFPLFSCNRFSLW